MLYRLLRRILMSSFFILISIIGTNGQNSQLEDALSNPNCEKWCWLGIELGTSSEEFVENTLQEYELVYHKNINPFDEDMIGYTINWAENRDKIYLFPYAGNYDTSIIHGYAGIISDVHTSVSNLSVETALAAIPSQPSHIRLFFGAPAIIYQDLGIVLIVSEMDSHQLNWIILSTWGGIELNIGTENLQPCIEPANLCNLILIKPLKKFL